MEKKVLVVDIGGSKYMGGLVSESGEIMYRKRQEWTSLAKEAVFASVCGAIDDVLEQNPGAEVQAVGMTIPGLADPKTGEWVSSGFMNIHDFPISQMLREKYGWPVYADNDARACVMAEKYFGAAQDSENFLYMTVSNGVGGALLLNGELFYGAFNNAGEVGQCIVVEDGRESNHNGTRGTLEAYCNAGGIAKTYLELGGMPTIDGEPASGKTIDQLARKGDAIALKTYELEGYYLGKAIASIYNVLDIEMVVIGGGLSLGFDLFEKSLMDTVRRQSYQRDTPFLKVVPTPLKYEGALMGAAALALHGLKKEG